MRDKSPEEIAELKKKLTEQGVSELHSREEVREMLSRDGLVMIVVNSVCSCAGKAIREGVTNALEKGINVDHKGTVFAGVDDEATEEVREQAPETEPSSPAVYLFRNGDMEEYIPRTFTMKENYEIEAVREKVEQAVRSARRDREPTQPQSVNA